MTEQEFLALVRQNPINAAILDRLPQLEAFAPGVMLVAGSLFGTVWNAQADNAPTDHIRDYDLFYWDADLSYEAEDAVIGQTAELFADLNAPIEIRNQARVHLWFNPKYGLNRPPLCSVREGIDQFLIECTCLGINAQGTVYAPYGLGDMEAGRLKRNALNHSPGLYAAKATSYQARWPWLRDEEDGQRP